MARILVLVLPLFVSGCFLPANLTIVSLVVNGFSVAATGKGTADHALSVIASRDCAILRLATSEAVCRVNETGPQPLAGEIVEQEGILAAGTKPKAASESQYVSPNAVPTALPGAMPR